MWNTQYLWKTILIRYSLFFSISDQIIVYINKIEGETISQLCARMNESSWSEIVSACFPLDFVLFFKKLL